MDPFNQLTPLRLLAEDESWIVGGLVDYIKHRERENIISTGKLREANAKYSLSSVVPPSRTLHNFGPSKEITLGDFSITRVGSSKVRIMSHIHPDEAERIYIFLYRDVKLYKTTGIVALPGISRWTLFDLTYLYPIHAEEIPGWVILRSDTYNSSLLQHLVDTGEQRFPIAGMDDITGVYASYLLAESISYRHPIRWENNALVVGDAGAIQGQDLFEHFVGFCTEVRKSREMLDKAPNFSAMLKIRKRAFFWQGVYYYCKTSPDLPPHNLSIDPLDVAEIENGNPLWVRSLWYLEVLGYDTTAPDPEKYDIQLGARLIEADGRSLAQYYYRCSSGLERVILQEESTSLDHLQELQLHISSFLSPKAKALLNTYPGFIPSCP